MKPASQELWIGQARRSCHKQRPEDGTNDLPVPHKWMAFVKGADRTPHSKSPARRTDGFWRLYKPWESGFNLLSPTAVFGVSATPIA